MRARHLLLASAGLFTVFAGNALAQEDVLNPVSNWAVKQVPGSDPTGSYCALARKFERNAIMTFARNSGKETSFALDFQKPLFEGDAEKFKVVLDPGAGQERSYDVKPVSSKAFVVKLGKDSSFFSAVEKSGFLRAEIGNKSYSFNLSDIDSGQDQLSSCVTAIIAPAAGEEEPVADPISEQVSDPVNDPVKEVIRQFSDEKPSAYAAPVIAPNDPNTADRVSALRQQIETLKQENRKLTGAIGQSTAAVASGASASDVKRMQELEKENEDLRVKLADVQKSAGANLIPADKKGEMEQLRQENATLKASLSSGGAQGAAIASLNTQIESLKSENTKLQTAIAGAAKGAEPVSSSDAEQQKLLKSLTDENRRLQEQLKESASKGDDATMKALIARLEQENRDLSAKVQTAGQDGGNQSIKAAEEEIARLKAQNQTLQSASSTEADKAKAIDTLKAQIEELKTKNAELSALTKQAATDADSVSSVKIKTLEEENKKLSAALKDGAPSQELVTSLRAQVAQMEQEKADIERNLSQAKTSQKSGDKAALEQSVAAAVKEKEDKIAALEAELTKYQDSGRILQEINRKMSALQEEASKQAELTAEKEKEIAALRKSFDEKGSAEKGNEAELHQKIGALEKENAVLNDNLEKTKAEITQVEILKAELESKTKQIEEQQSKIDILKASMSKGTQDVALIDQLNQQLAEAQAKNIQLSDELAESAQASLKAGEMDAQLQDALGKAEKASALQKELAEIRAELEAVRKDSESSALALAQKDQELSGVKTQLEAALEQSMQVDALSQQVKAKEEENARIREKINTAMAAAETEVASVIDFFKNENAVLRKTVTEEQAKSAEYQKAAAKLAALEAQNTEMKTALDARAASDDKAAADLKAALAENATLKTAAAEQTALVAQLEKTLNESVKENERLNLALKAGDAEKVAAMEKTQGDLTLAQADAAKLRADNAKLVAELEALKSDTTVAELQTKFKDLEAENLKLAQSLEESETALSAMQADMLKKDEQIAALEAEKTQLVAALEQKTTGDEQVASAQDDLKATHEENESLKDRLVALEKKLAAGPKQEEIAALQSRIDLMKAENAILRKDASGYKEMASRKSEEAGKAVIAAMEARKEAEERAARMAKTEAETLSAMEPAAGEPEVAQPKKQDITEESKGDEGSADPVAEPVADNAAAPVTHSEASMAAEAQAREAALAKELEETRRREKAGLEAAKRQAAQKADEAEAAAVKSAQKADSEAGALVARKSEDPFAPFGGTEPGADTDNTPARSNGRFDMPSVHLGRKDNGGEAGDMAKAEPVAMDDEPADAPDAPVREDISREEERAASAASFSPSFNIEDVIVQQQIAAPGQVRSVPAKSTDGKLVYQWMTGKEVFGSAEQQAIPAGGYDRKVSEYLEKTKSRCDGDFAAVMDDSVNNAGARIDTYEIACVGNGVNSSASILFVDKDGTFSAVAHEAPTEHMDDAMAMRDKVARALGGRG